MVEPDDAAAEAVGVLLRLAGYRVTRHADLSAALEALAAFQPAMLLVATGSLLALTAGELMATLHRRAPGPGLILLASESPSPAEIAAARAAGAAIIAKPVLRRELAAALAEQLARPRKGADPAIS